MRNIKLAYVISFLSSAKFWTAIWILFYLRYTNYAGIGFIESVMIVTATFTEIPTGAIADLLGKKNTLLVSFLLSGAGHFMMAFAPSVQIIVLSVFIMTTGTSLFSGTLEALIYDSLKEESREGNYDKIIANIHSTQLIASAFAAIVGGLLYTLSPSLPFVGVAIAYLFAIIVGFLLHEPRIDTEKFSLKTYIHQMWQGFRELNKPAVKAQAYALLIFGFIFVITYEVLSDVLLVEFGFNATQLGIIVSIIYLVCSATSQVTPYLTRRFGEMKSALVFSAIGSGTLLLTPFVNMIGGGIANIVRASAFVNLDNVTSTILNRHTESKYRATTLSTFNMLQRLPYVLLAYPIGGLMDKYTARGFAFGLGIVAMTVVVLVTVFLKSTRKLSF